MSKFLLDAEDHTDDTKVIAIPWIFSKNSLSKNAENSLKSILVKY